jgi:hypothetical protein
LPAKPIILHLRLHVEDSMRHVFALLFCVVSLAGCQTDQTSTSGSFTSCQSIGTGGTANVIC